MSKKVEDLLIEHINKIGEQIKEPIQVFVSYSHNDKEFADELLNHLSVLSRDSSFLSVWSDKAIRPGNSWDQEIKHKLINAELVLILVSSDFFASDYSYNIEMQKARTRHEQDECLIVPIVIRPVVWKTSPLAKLQALPPNAKPVSTYSNRDEAWVDVVTGIINSVSTVLERRRSKAYNAMTKSIKGFHDLAMKAIENIKEKE